MFKCESCGDSINTFQYRTLSKNELYFEQGLIIHYFIIQKSCEDLMWSKWGNLEIVDSTEDLLLVHVWDKDEDEN